MRDFLGLLFGLAIAAFTVIFMGRLPPGHVLPVAVITFLVAGVVLRWIAGTEKGAAALMSVVAFTASLAALGAWIVPMLLIEGVP